MSLIEFIQKTEPDFKKVAKSSGTALNFERECRFAMQLIKKNDYTMQTASNNKASLYNALVNVSAVGLSLNPANAHAYLVPRDGSICLDISYRGMIKLATDTGIIKWVRAQIIYEKDDFEFYGPAKEPKFISDPFLKDKGEFKGVYCIAKTNEGDILTDVMSADDIYQVRDTSKAYISAVNKKKLNSVWHLWFDEMAKKTIIKRASKTWPQSDGSDRLYKAIDVVNDHEGIEIEETFFNDSDYDKFKTLIKEEKAFELHCFYQTMDIEQKTSIMGAYINTAPRGMKGEWRKMVNALLEQGYDSVLETVESINNYALKDDVIGANEIFDELNDLEKDQVMNLLNPNELCWVNEKINSNQDN